MSKILFCFFMCVPLMAQDGLLGMSLPADYVPFSPDSPWNTPIGDKPKVDDFSKDMIKKLKKEARHLKADMTKWTIPLFVIDSTKAPKMDIPTRGSGLFHTVDPDKNNIAEDIPMPVGVWPDPERDAHLLLVDPALGRSWDFSYVQMGGGRITASRIDTWDLKGRGYRKAFLGEGWWLGGARGSGMPLIAGLVRPEQIEAGRIPHALVFGAPTVRSSTFEGGGKMLCSPPASRTDGQNMGFEFLPMGARLQLDPDLNLDVLGLSEPTKIIARAMQEYGMYLGDGAGAFKIYLQNLGPDGKAWKRYGDFKDLKKIPIDRFRVLNCRYRMERMKRKR